MHAFVLFAFVGLRILSDEHVEEYSNNIRTKTTDVSHRYCEMIEARIVAVIHVIGNVIELSIAAAVASDCTVKIRLKLWWSIRHVVTRAT